MKGIFSILMLIIILSACKKDAVQNGNSNPPPPPPALDSNYIDTLYKTITRGSITDTVAYYKYNYDNLKRVTLVKWEINDFGQSNNGGGTEIYSYNNNDMLPYSSYRTSSLNLTTLLTDTIIFYHWYDNGGRLIKDSVMQSHRTAPGVPSAGYFLRKRGITYQYSNALIIKKDTNIAVYDPGNNINYNSTDSTFLSPTGNPVLDRFFSGILPFATATITYDNMINPHTKLNIFKAFSPAPLWSLPDFYTSFIGQNNYVSYKNISPAPFDYNNFNSIFSNIYLPSGYLLKTTANGQYPPTDIVSWIYKYKAL